MPDYISDIKIINGKKVGTTTRDYTVKYMSRRNALISETLDSANGYLSKTQEEQRKNDFYEKLNFLRMGSKSKIDWKRLQASLSK